MVAIPCTQVFPVHRWLLYNTHVFAVHIWLLYHTHKSSPYTADGCYTMHTSLPRTQMVAISYTQVFSVHIILWLVYTMHTSLPRTQMVTISYTQVFSVHIWLLYHTHKSSQYTYGCSLSIYIYIKIMHTSLPRTHMVDIYIYHAHNSIFPVHRWLLHTMHTSGPIPSIYTHTAVIIILYNTIESSWHTTYVCPHARTM